MVSLDYFSAFSIAYTNTIPNLVFSLVSAIAALESIRAAMSSLKRTGTDFASSQGMDPKTFFEVMGLGDIVKFDMAVGGSSLGMI